MSTALQKEPLQRFEPTAESDLPEGWASVLLSEVCDINPSKPHSDALPADAPVTFVPMPAVDAEAGAITKTEVRPFAKVRNGFTAFREADVIFAKITPCMENGKAAIARNLRNGLAFGSTEFHVLRSNGVVLPEYVYRFIRQESFRKAAEAEMTGSVGQRRVPADFLRHVELPVAPLAEQERIVAKIEELLVQVNSIRARLAKAAQIMKRFRRSVLAAACSGRVTEDWRVTAGSFDRTEVVSEILARRRANWSEGRYRQPDLPIGDLEFELPETWAVVSFDQVTTLITKGSSPRWQGFEYQDEGVFFLRSQNVRWGNLDLSERTYLHERFNRDHPTSVIREGDVLLNLVGASVGRAAIATSEIQGANCNQAVSIIRLVSGALLNSWVLYYLLSPMAQNHISENKADVARANFNLDDIKVMPLPLPPLHEQREIVRRVDALFKLADTIEKRVEAAARRADTLTQAILAKAFRGELVPTEAELARREGRYYETAAVLLERVRTERACVPEDAEYGRRPKQARIRRHEAWSQKRPPDTRVSTP
jgi:type I restriction enzyme S subunit